MKTPDAETCRGRESNFPTLQDVEPDGVSLEGSVAKKLWSRHADQGYMAVPGGKDLSPSEKSEFGTKCLAAKDRERIKRCLAHFLIGPGSGTIQAEVACSLLDALSDDHLADLDVMGHDYKSGTGVHQAASAREIQ